MSRKRVQAEQGEVKGNARHWCVTFFLPDGSRPEVLEKEEQEVADADQDPQRVRYALWQREIAPETGRQHWQGYIEFLAPCKGTAILKAVGVRRGDQRLRELRRGEIHWERRRGTREEARDYCKKQDTRDPRDGSGPFEWGTPCNINCIHEPCARCIDIDNECQNAEYIRFLFIMGEVSHIWRWLPDENGDRDFCTSVFVPNTKL